MNDSTRQLGEVHLHVANNVATVTLDNPKRLNALPQRLWEALPQHFSEAIRQDARVIIVAGEDGNFCAGADISEFDAVRKNEHTAQAYENANEAAFSAVRETLVPVIAQIDGICFGGGFGIAAACDLRIASDRARFSVPAAKLGLAYPVKAMADIVHAVGAQNAKRLLYTADIFNAQALQAMGFLGDVVPEDELKATVRSLANGIANLAPLSHRATKAAVAAALTGETQEAQALGAATFASDDYAEGRAAFREKRKPRFRGC